jgi:hypothetical protein
VLKKNRRDLFKKYSIESLGLFGSITRSDYHESSDIDILVEFKENIGIRFIDCADEIESLLGAKVDLVSMKAIRNKYFKSIKKDIIYV